MTRNLSKAHALYPRQKELAEGKAFNSDPFFYFWSPEELQQKILKGCVKKIRGVKVPHVQCFDHSNCWNVAVANERLFFEDCEEQFDFDIKSELHRQKSEFPQICEITLEKKIRDEWSSEREDEILKLFFEGVIISADQIKQKIAGAQASSQFFHPFEGFEKVDAPTVPTSWTIQDLIPDKSIGAIYGERESLKSFLTLDMALCVATGTAFNGAATRQGSVLYFAPEGSTGIGIRRDAWKAQNGWEDKFVPFYSRGGSFSFTSQQDRDYLADLLAFAHDFAPRLVIFDTLGQSLGDADENSASDINKIARFLNDLKLAHDCSFLWVDHSGHESKRARGSSAKGGALDFEYFVKRKGEHIEVRNTKMKDAPRSKPFTMEASPRHGSLVLEHVAPNPSHADLLLAVIAEASDHCETELRATFYEKTTACTPEAKQKAFQRSVGKLIDEEKIMKVEAGQSTKLVLKRPSGHTHPPL